MATNGHAAAACQSLAFCQETCASVGDHAPHVDVCKTLAARCIKQTTDRAHNNHRSERAAMNTFDLLSYPEMLVALHELAERATAHYHLPGSLLISMVNLSENATFRVQAPDGTSWALRIHRPGYHSRLAIASELAWLQDLRSTGIVITPVPVLGRDGELIQSVCHPKMTTPRHVVLSEWETGAEPAIEQDLSAHFETLGEVTARMHGHITQWSPPSWFIRPVWNFDTALGPENPHWGRWRDGMGVKGDIIPLFERTVDLIGKRLARYGMDRSNFGLIHCDLRLANLLIDGTTIKVIDFDDCGFGWFMYDAVTPVSFYEHEPHVPDLIDAWKTGYRRVRPLAQQDEAEIPTFFMLRRLLLVAWIGSHNETELAKSMGLNYTDGTTGLCETFLSKYS
jgi:Ser/Thr protein kinase RdoA (MazF antagonist)